MLIFLFWLPCMFRLSENSWVWKQTCLQNPFFSLFSCPVSLSLCPSPPLSVCFFTFLVFLFLLTGVCEKHTHPHTRGFTEGVSTSSITHNSSSRGCLSAMVVSSTFPKSFSLYIPTYFWKCNLNIICTTEYSRNLSCLRFCGIIHKNPWPNLSIKTHQIDPQSDSL